MAIVRATGSITNGDLSFFTSASVNGVDVLSNITLASPKRWQLEWDDDGLPDGYQLLITAEDTAGNEITRERSYKRSLDEVAGSVIDSTNPVNSSNYALEIVTTTGDTFTTRLILDSGVPAELWYRVQGEPEFTRREPSETSNTFSTHKQTAPGTESKTISTGDTIEYYWKFGLSLEHQTTVESFLSVGQSNHDIEIPVDGTTISDNSLVVTWADNRTDAQASDRADLWLDFKDGNGFVDQGPSVLLTDGQWRETISLGSTAANTVVDGRLYFWRSGEAPILDEQGIPISDDFVPFSFYAQISGNSALQYVMPATGTTPMPKSVWESMTDNAYNDITGDTSLLSIVEEDAHQWIKAEHKAGQVADLTGKSRLGNLAPYARSKMIMKLASNFKTGTNGYYTGKLGLGLIGGDQLHSSGAYRYPVSGGSTSTEGFSFRHGWTATSQTAPIEHIIYSYYMNRPGMNYPGTPPAGPLYGDHIKTGLILTPGEEDEIWLDVHVNTPGNTDGFIEVWHNGVSLLKKTGLIMMDGTPIIDKDMWASNHGGNASQLDWAPPTDTHVLYRNMEIVQLS